MTGDQIVLLTNHASEAEGRRYSAAAGQQQRLRGRPGSIVEPRSHRHFELARAARQRGLGLMVGCMGGTSLSMAPTFVAGLLCDFHDLDGPLLLKNDRSHGLQYNNGEVVPPSPRLWG